VTEQWPSAQKSSPAIATELEVDGRRSVELEPTSLMALGKGTPGLGPSDVRAMKLRAGAT
jgi:hypothetical protein